MSRADPPAPLADEELRLECARLAAVFSEPDSVMANASRMYRFIKEGDDGDRPLSSS